MRICMIPRNTLLALWHNMITAISRMMTGWICTWIACTLISCAILISSTLTQCPSSTWSTSDGSSRIRVNQHICASVFFLATNTFCKFRNQYAFCFHLAWVWCFRPSLESTELPCSTWLCWLRQRSSTPGRHVLFYLDQPISMAIVEPSKPFGSERRMEWCCWPMGYCIPECGKYKCWQM